MSVVITDDCISCDLCEPQCPNMAISRGQGIYLVDANLCTECDGFYDIPACIAVCPLDCIEYA